MDCGVVFSLLPGTPVGRSRSFSDWMRAAERVFTTTARVGFRFVAFTHSYQYGGMPTARDNGAPGTRCWDAADGNTSALAPPPERG